MEQAPFPAMKELAQLNDLAGMKRNATVPRYFGGRSYSWVVGVPMTGLHYSMSYFFEVLGAK